MDRIGASDTIVGFAQIQDGKKGDELIKIADDIEGERVEGSIPVVVPVSLLLLSLGRSYFFLDLRVGVQREA